MSSIETNNQAVRECIVLARGYSPGTLQPVINYAGSYNGKQVWLLELAKVSEMQFGSAFQSITNELAGSTLRVGKEKTFETAVKEKNLLSTGELLSPVTRNNGYRSRYVLWSVPAGTEIAICISSNGMQSLKAELLGLVAVQSDQSSTNSATVKH